MTLSNNLKQQVDLPVWEWCRFAPFNSGASYSLTGDESCLGGTTGRYLYYLAVGTLTRYDTVTDTWQYLSAPQTAQATVCAAKYTSQFGSGYRGNILDATSDTVTIAGLQGNKLVGFKIRIVGGTGVGQERTILSITDPVILEHGVPTTATALVITDTAKKWDINQWIGCQVRIVFSTGQAQIRKILYNDATSFTVADTNFQALEPWNNTAFATAPIATAGSQSHYFIEQSVATVDSSWTTTPDASSSFEINTGGLWALSTVTLANGSASWQYYDVASDTWFYKTSLGVHTIAAVATDLSIDKTDAEGGTFTSGTVDSGSGNYTMVGASAPGWGVDRWTNYSIVVHNPATGIKQTRRIIGNTTDTLHVHKKWDTNPTNTYTYEIVGDTDCIWFAGNAQASMYKYLPEEDLWTTSHFVDSGVTRQISAQYGGQEAFTVSTATVNVVAGGASGGIKTVTVASGGTGYMIGDVLTVGGTGGTLGKVRVTSISPGGIVSGISLYALGINYSTTANPRTVTSGSGSSCTVNVTSVYAGPTYGGYAGKVTTVTNHNLCIGDSVTIAGCDAGSTAWNGTYTIVGADAANVFEVATSATGSAAAAYTMSTSQIVDASKNWTVNEHVGKLVTQQIVGVAPVLNTSSFTRRITANTPTTLTVAAAGVAAVNGTSRYHIHEPNAFARTSQWKIPARSNVGWATGGGPTALADSTKAWWPNQWAGYKFRVICGTGRDSEITVTSNNENTLVYASPGWTADTTTKYMIMDTYGIYATGSTTTITDTAKNWTVNQFAGKRVRITAGGGEAQEATIASNTATTLTLSAALATAPDTTSCYTILDTPVRGAGMAVRWIYGNTVLATKGKYMWISRGGSSNVIDRYDITKDTVDLTLAITPMGATDVFAAGTAYAYDGADRLYVTPATATVARVFSIDVNTLYEHGSSTPPYGHSTAVLGNKMQIAQTADGLKFLYIIRNTGAEVWRTLLFW